MKSKLTFIFGMLALVNLMTGCCCRHTRIAEDITPENCFNEHLDWHYGLGDIRIQTLKLSGQLMDRWIDKSEYDISCGKPRIIITEIDNCTDEYISTDMIRDVIESAAIEDGRFTVVVGNMGDERELDYRLNRILQDPKYSNSTRLQPGKVKAPQFLAKIRITKAMNFARSYDYVDYRMTVTLYDIETQEAIDSAWDVLSKRIRRF